MMMMMMMMMMIGKLEWKPEEEEVSRARASQPARQPAGEPETSGEDEFD
jgi:hypothetical protein